MKLSPPLSRSVKMDCSSSTVSYIGEAPIGAATSDAVWRIKRMTNIGTSLTIDWADSNAEFDNVWDNRASLTYG